MQLICSDHFGGETTRQASLALLAGKANRLPSRGHLASAARRKWREYTLGASSPLDRPITARLIHRMPEIDPASDACLATFEIDNGELALACLKTMYQPQ